VVPTELEEVIMVEDVQKIIERSIPQATVYVLDPMNDGRHLQAIVVSPVFAGVSLVKQHQMVMKPLQETLKDRLHALGLKTFTPEKWEEVKDTYEI
jgi:acid stress-induced BolA-like protein IbaG/YrbA